MNEIMLRAAAARSAEAYLRAAERDFPAAHAHIFSAAFEKRLNKLIRRSEYPGLHKALRSVAAALAAVVMAGSLWLAADTDARAAFVGWIKGIYEGHFVYRYEGGSASTAPTEYRPTWIPEGYSEYRIDKFNGNTVIIYTDENERRLRISYAQASDNLDWRINITSSSTFSASVNGYSAELFISSDESIANAITWINDNDTVFAVSAFLDKDEIIMLAESIEDIK